MDHGTGTSGLPPSDAVGRPRPSTTSLEDVPRPMSLLPRPGVVVFVADVPAMRRFYQALASMTLLHEDQQHAVLEIEGFQLVIHAIAGASPVVAPPGDRVPPREDSYLKACLPVESIAAARARAATFGGCIRPPESEWAARGFRACDGQDPEGNVLQVREGAA